MPAETSRLVVLHERLACGRAVGASFTEAWRPARADALSRAVALRPARGEKCPLRTERSLMSERAR